MKRIIVLCLLLSAVLSFFSCDNNKIKYYDLLDKKYSSIYKINNIAIDLYDKIGLPEKEAISNYGNIKAIYDWGDLFYQVSSEGYMLIEITANRNCNILNEKLRNMNTRDEFILLYSQPESESYGFLSYYFLDCKDGWIQIFYDNNKNIQKYYCCKGTKKK